MSKPAADKNRMALIAIMSKHDLTSAQVGKLLGLTPEHVRAMRCGRARTMHRTINHLKLSLG
jgi:hypothetical protein